MGYTHYWYRDKEIDPEVYTTIVMDFQKLIPILERQGIKLADGMGEDVPQIDYEDVWFNGDSHCGHPANHELVIPWPTERASGVSADNQAINGEWFAGVQVDKRCCNGDCSYETFGFPRVITKAEPVGEILYYDQSGKPVYNSKPTVGKYFDCCKTAFRPYDWAVTAFLVIAKHHLRDKIIVRSDGELPQWQDAMLLCQLELDYGMDFKLGD